MYKVLLADDEIMILEGIASIVDWNRCGTELIATAHNGQMAFDKIQLEKPDIVICDIKMPGMTGLELIENVNELNPEIKFIIISGFDDFGYAKMAMRYGVNHYLLKPCNETKIEEALLQVTGDLDKKNQKDKFIQTIRDDLASVMPKAKEQFLKEYITNKTYGIREWEYYSKLFGIDAAGKKFRLIVVMIDDQHDFEQVFVLKEIGSRIMEEYNKLYLSTTIGERIVLLIEDVPDKELIEKLEDIRKSFEGYYASETTTAVSNSGTIDHLRILYNETLECLTHRFYLGAGSIITTSDINSCEVSSENFQFDHENLIMAVRGGNYNDVKQYLNEFFVTMKREKYEESLAKLYSMELFLTIIRQAKKEKMNALFQQIGHIQTLDTLDQIQEFITSISEEMTEYIYKGTKQTQSTIIKNVIQYVEENLSKQSLSLSKISNEIFYMNTDYLGKLFKKETGEKFSAFLVKLRVLKAIELMENMDEVKVFEVADQVGFGDNSRYFSQVFKKYTGYTPSEFLEHKDKRNFG
ncbi:hypothetical protein KP78_05050 [Jeotgalibacillus soli]|uniref:AraC family transcriptional regulator n=1 Tax=Jeotgalibacillus soli TaxID=889306 RepID=A0A0C2RPE8_9BACL|nr:hypothetical protein KP78_05050 [Jeotgalibacillus soli]